MRVIPRPVALTPTSSTADNLQAVALLVGSVAALIIAIAVASVVVSRRMKHLDTKFTTKLGSIEVAVNNVPADMPPLVAQVSWLFQVIEMMAMQAGFDLPPKPTPNPDTDRTRKDDQ